MGSFLFTFLVKMLYFNNQPDWLNSAVYPMGWGKVF